MELSRSDLTKKLEKFDTYQEFSATCQLLSPAEKDLSSKLVAELIMKRKKPTKLSKKRKDAESTTYLAKVDQC